MGGKRARANLPRRMDAADIRSKFLDFFAAREHTVVPSSSLIPVDPTLLLTVAGMVQFKAYMLGEEPPPYPRAVTAQKCVRTEDIEIIGTTDKHLTFFEMLGNFSFGDYFKEKAIPWAYEFVTEHLRLDPELLWYTVYDTDDEAREIWVDGVGVPPERVQAGGRDNFWQMGVAGPCGPSSEIFFDRGAEHGEEGGPIGGADARYTEIWNLVFMQNIQDEPYHVVGELPAKNIDTGMGLDRIAAVLQDAPSVFHTDLLRPVLAAAEEATATGYGADPGTDVSLRILADHGRALTFLIGDGVVPSNEGRGYIVRRLLRRAARHAWSLGSRDLITPVLIAATVEAMGDAYPALRAGQAGIADMAVREEERFRTTLESGHQLLDAELRGLEEGDTLAGVTAFKLHDTYGFPVELTEEIAAERGYGVDRFEFETMMDAQRERARKAWKGGTEGATELYREVLDEAGPTEFVGYTDPAASGRLLSIVREGETVERAEEGQEVEVFLDRTPFYAESGGQVGDTGSITTETGELRVTDTQFGLPGLHGHRATVVSGFVQVGQDAAARIDGERRERIRKAHTGTHLLHWGLRHVLGAHVQQAGSLVTADRLRFDFSHYSGLEPDELAGIESEVNRRIYDNERVRAFETSMDEARKLGALAFFGDKYGDRVRVVEAGDYSLELCGGTHVPSTGQVGPLLLLGEGSIGSNMRRVEALVGEGAYTRVVELRRRLHDAAAALGSQPDNVVAAVGSLQERLAAAEERLSAFEDRARSDQAATLAERAETQDGTSLVVAATGDLAPDALRTLAMQVRDRIGQGVVVLGASRDGKGSLVAVVSRDLAGPAVSAGEILAPAAKLLGGGGSRDPELAQAGGPHGERLADALAAARSAAAEALASP